MRLFHGGGGRGARRRHGLVGRVQRGNPACVASRRDARSDARALGRRVGGRIIVTSPLGEQLRQPAVHTQSFGWRALDGGGDNGRGGW
jgi:hypothetical protein